MERWSRGGAASFRLLAYSSAYYPSDSSDFVAAPYGTETSTVMESEVTENPGESFEGYVKNQRSGMWGFRTKGTLQMDVVNNDPGLNQLLVSEGSTISRLFTQDDWERHRGVDRYWRHLSTTFKSTIFLRILEPVLLITAVAAALTGFNTILAPMWSLPALYISPLAHQLTGAVLSLSLVFRTNNANGRLMAARALLAKMVKCTRDLTRMCQYVPNEENVRAQVLALLQAFPYALEAHVRQGRTRTSTNDPTAFRVDPVRGMSRVLGVEHATRLAQHENIPARVLLDMSTKLHRGITIGMSTQMHQQCELILKELSDVLASSEKILHTPMPISFTRHTSRILCLWLITLPMALWDLLGPSMVPAIFLMTYLLFGVDEIGVEIEEPFCVLPVRPLADMCSREITESMEQALRAPDFKPAPKK